MIHSSSFTKKSFTLIELMVSISVAVMIMLFLTQTISYIAVVLKNNREKSDVNSEIRIVFDRIANDFKMMPKRMDIGFKMTNDNVGEDFLRIISHVNAVNTDRGLSLVGYKIDVDKNGRYGLYRGVHGYDWNDIGFMGITPQGIPVDLANLPESLNLQPSDYELFSQSIFRLAIAFQYKNSGKLSKYPPLYRWGTNQTLSIQITNIASVVVCVATMDQNNNKLLNKNTTDLLNSNEKFSEIPDDALPLSHWNTNLLYHFNEFSKGLPLPVAQSVRIYQRFFNLD